jgi:ribokinase
VAVTAILISGLINLEVTLQVDNFPIDYTPVRYPFFGVNSTVSGVGYNVAKALIALGDTVHLMSIVGRDAAGTLVSGSLRADGIPQDLVLPRVERTPHSVILYDRQGKRQINVDLKDIQDQVYPEELSDEILDECSTAVLCNINFSRPLLTKAKERGKLIATDVHAVSDLDDAYNQDFMRYADVLFMSDELLPCTPEEWARAVQGRYGPEVLVIGLGARGALLAVRSDRVLERVPVVHTRQVVSTIGAGDALFSAFVHLYSRSKDACEAMRKAVVFASYKIGEAGAAEGFLDADALDNLCKELRGYE